jgi:acetolactate synthase-1/2/3 large subunit
MTGVFGAYVDGLPMIVISGQCKSETTCRKYGLISYTRQVGEQEAQAVEMAHCITKYSVSITDSRRICYELEKSLKIATSGRPGPVWIEIPVDIQCKSIDIDDLPKFKSPIPPSPDLRPIAKRIISSINSSKRPALVIGPALNDPCVKNNFLRLAEKLQCPILCAGVQDVITKNHYLYSGSIGNLGSRAGNINIQNADLLLFLGVTMHITFTTYNWQAMGKNAYKIVVECEASECERPQFLADEIILSETVPMIDALGDEFLISDQIVDPEWLAFCRERVHTFPVVPESLRTVDGLGRINPYYFTEVLFNRLDDLDIVVPANGIAGAVAQQVGVSKKHQRLIANFGNGPMGFALPASVGACAASKGHRIICLEGDGSVMLNIQELATIKCHYLPVLIFIYNNNGYVSIKLTQKNFFNNEFGAGPNSGLGQS